MASSENAGFYRCEVAPIRLRTPEERGNRSSNGRPKRYILTASQEVPDAQILCCVDLPVMCRGFGRRRRSCGRTGPPRAGLADGTEAVLCADRAAGAAG